MNEPELPDEFLIQEAENGDRVTAKGGETEFIVVVDEYSGERQTVRADAVDWDGWHEHPALQAGVGAIIAVLALLGPIALGAYTVDGFAAAAQENGETGKMLYRNLYALGAMFGAAGTGTALMVLNRTRIPWWLHRWERYTDVRRDLKRAGESDR